MTELEQMTRLVNELGSKLELQAILEHEEAEWSVVFDGNAIVELTYESSRKCLTLEIDLGTCDLDRRQETLESLMTYAGLTEQTGGIRIALNSPDGEFIQLLDVFIENLDVAQLATVLSNFVKLARSWRTALSAGGIAFTGNGVRDEPAISPALPV